ncbi:hypothetical protein GQ53DRAFT_748421 [Thozetella sp. PMI_491]|nr:hypothetical protein GQ53DRAFT_748421 [Thozetella sp. PMI_491]
MSGGTSPCSIPPLQGFPAQLRALCFVPRRPLPYLLITVFPPVSLCGEMSIRVFQPILTLRLSPQSSRRLQPPEDPGDTRHSSSPLPALHPQARSSERTAGPSLVTILNGRPVLRVPPNAREELLRALGDFNQSLHEARRFVGSRDQDQDTDMSSGPGRDLRRRFNRDPPLANEPLPSTASPNPPSLPPLRSLGSRRESSMSASPGGVGTRSRSLVARWANNYRSLSSITSDLADLDRNLESANSHLQALLDYTIENPSQPYMSTLSPPPAQPEHAEETRRIKRRKVDSDRLSPTFKNFRYGKYGQVEPGPLKMEIVSCDGGLYSSGLVSDATSYAVENILKNDSSVYCTKGNRCNIVLRHQGATVFSLKELVIKAPGLDYSSP